MLGASQDYDNVLRWTMRDFGRYQARAYETTLREALRALRSGPNTIGVKQRDDLPLGLRTLHVARNGRKGSHFIVYRVNGERTIDVLRILHDGMDLPGHI
jgi:toxin ParE1/3/4